MSAGTVASGVIVFLLGVIGLLQLYQSTILPVNLAIISAFLTTLGAVLIFGVIAIVGVGLMVSGLATLGEPRDSVEKPMTQPTAVVEQQAGSSGRTTYDYSALGSLELATLRYTSQGKTTAEISSATGTPEATIEEKMVNLRAGGFLTDKNVLTEKGSEVLRSSDQARVYVAPSP